MTNTSKHPPRPWTEIDTQIIAALDLRAEYQQLGVKITGREPNVNGWIECRAVGREDRTPSAAVNVRTGRYKDFGGEGTSLSLWDFAATSNGTDWRNARKMFAKKAGVKLPGGRPPNRPDDNLEFLKWSTTLVKQWCASKPPIGPEAVKALGGRMAKYRGQYTVIALPVFGPQLLDADPVGWVLFEISGKDLPVFHGKDKPPTWVKVKTTAGSTAGIMGTVTELVGTGPKTVWKTEGPSDAMALLTMIPSDDRDKFLIVTNSGGAAEHPRPEIVKLLSGHKVIVIGDGDRPGQIGAERWAGAIVQVGTETRNVQLPYQIEPKHGRDLRDYFADGHTFADLVKLAERTEPVKLDEVRPQIIDGIDEPRVIDEAIAALAANSGIYRRAGMLVHVVRDGDTVRGIDRPKDTPRIAPLRLARLRELLASAADWKRLVEDGELCPIHPPKWAVQAVDARGEWRGIPPLDGVIDSPRLRSDGTILQRPGYDALTGLLYDPAIDFPEIPDRPTKDDAVRAAAELLEVVTDFPFEKRTHCSAWLAGAITPFARPAIDGPTPAFPIDGNTRGVGKTLAADCIGVIVTGHPMPRMALPRTDDEFRKQITGLAIDGTQLVLTDNASGPLGSPALDAALTGTAWRDRILGESRMTSELPLNMIWYFTGNNMSYTGDTIRRLCHIRLETKQDRPEERSDFLHPALLQWIGQERGRLVAACLTILRAYYVAGRPDQELVPWGSYESWSAMVRQPIVWVGMPDPGEVRQDLAEKADQEANILRTLIAGWEEADPPGYGMTVSAALKLLADYPNDYEAMRSAIGELSSSRSGASPNTRSLGMRFHHLRRRVVGSKFFDKRDSRKGAVWFVGHVEGEAPGP